MRPSTFRLARLVGLGLLLAAGCQGGSGIDLSALDRSVEPCDDFYRFACGGWIDAHPLDGNDTRVTRFSEPFQEEVPRLYHLLEEAAAGARPDDDPNAALTGAYYASCLKAPTDLSSRDELRALLEQVDAAASLEQLLIRVAAHRDLGSRAFFNVSVGADPGDTTRHVVTIDQGGYELPDRSYYLDADQANLRSDYLAHIDQLSALIDTPPQIAGQALAVLQIETTLAEASLPPDERRDPRELYHPMTQAELAALTPHIPWHAFWEASGFGELDRVNVAVPAHLAAVDKLFASTPLYELKAYLRWELLQDRSSALDQAFIDADFLFFSQLSGQTVPQERPAVCLSSTLGALGSSMAVPYIARYYDEHRSRMAADLLIREHQAFAARLEAAPWIDGPTRRAALVKLAALAARLGHPKGVPSFDGLVLGGSLLENIHQLARYRSRASLDRLSRPVDRSAWPLTAVTVNASYSPLGNDLTVPAGILASPFLAPDRSNAANFGGLGVVIGHELSHGFDDRGRHFGSDGTLREWWTAASEQGFTERAQCVVEQYDGFEALPGEYVNGQLTLGENLADLGGLNLAHDALFDGSEPPRGGDGFTASQVFFLAYAQVWCENRTPEFLSKSLLTDPHSPGRFRVNGPLSNLDTFREAFSCPEGSPMVRPPELTCKLW